MGSSPFLYSIGELEKKGAILAIQDGNHGEKHPVSDDYVESGIPFIMARDISDGYLDVNLLKKNRQTLYVPVLPNLAMYCLPIKVL